MIYVLSGGQTGATLTVTSSGAGTITVSNTTLGKSYSKSVTAGGSVVFKGLKTGTWTIKLTNGSKTSTKTITITNDYSTNIAYFSATISITYPAKSTCVVKNSSGQTVASNTNTGTSTKTWTATVNATGTYTVTATATDGSGKSKSQDVSIESDGQSVSVTLNYALIIIENGEPVQGYAWENPDAYAPVYEVIKPIIANVKQYKNMVYTIYIDTLVNSSAYFEIGLFSGLSYASSAVQTTKYNQNSGILNAGNAKEFVVPIASTVPNDCYIGTYHASLQGHIIDLRLE